MDIVVNGIYEDRCKRQWRVIDVNGQKLFPVTAARWEGKRYVARCFQRDGRYEKDQDDPLDLVKRIS